jgi:hypothetical protein|tara:strand:- start:100 stop:780 length:681 start_codon:yes stop_codon:yes gene_type:complete
MEFNYGEKMKDLQFAKLANELQKKGITIRTHFGAAPKYGFNEITEVKKTYQIVMDKNVVFESKYYSDRDAAFDAFSPYLTLDSVDAKVIKTSKKWMMVEGSLVRVDFELEGTQNDWYDRKIEYENGQYMTVTLSNSTDGVILRFITTWNPDGIQRKDTIEEVMVNGTLNDMAKIQSIIEGRLKLKKFGIDIESASIDCHFDAKTESRSECAPDIINRVKEAKKAHS